MSKNAFALSLDKTATVIQHIVEERNKPGFDLLCKVFEVYPNVSKDWLMQGSGSMFPFEKNADISAVLPNDATAAAEVTAPKPALVETLDATVSTSPAVAAEPVAVVAAPRPAALPAIPVVESTAAATAMPAASVAAAAAPSGWEAAIYAQQLQHQLAMAEMRNQHLLEQQKMLQQMVELLRQTK